MVRRVVTGRRAVMAEKDPRTYAFGTYLWQPGQRMYVCPLGLRHKFKGCRKHAFADGVDVDHITAALQRYTEDLLGEGYTSSVECLEDGRLELRIGRHRRTT